MNCCVDAIDVVARVALPNGRASDTCSRTAELGLSVFVYRHGVRDGVFALENEFPCFSLKNW